MTEGERVISRAMKYAAFLLLAVLACGPKPGPGGATSVLPDVPFEQLDHDQKIQFMKQVVVPAMRPVFQAMDEKRYMNFGCRTCHGSSSDRDLFHMPNDELPKLNLADLSKFDPRKVEIMKTEVKPKMARLLKEPEYTPETPDGFGCLHCHPQVQ